MSQAEQPNTTRRSFLKMAPAGLVTAGVVATVLPELATPRERIDWHTQQLRQAWLEYFGEASTITEFSQSHKYLLIAGPIGTGRT